MPTPPQALVVFADPALQRSRLSRRVGNAARTFPDVQVQDLYELYPDFYIDAHSERQLLKGARLVIFSFQLAWYSMPSLLKEWVDSVLEPGWAYGPAAPALRGKGYWLAVTTGSPEDAYGAGERHGRPFEDYLPPFEQTALLCGMQWWPPHILHGANGATRPRSTPTSPPSARAWRPSCSPRRKHNDHGTQPADECPRLPRRGGARRAACQTPRPGRRARLPAGRDGDRSLGPGPDPRSRDILHFSEFGVVLLLFLIGLELEPRACGRCGGRSSAGARAQVLGVAGVLFGAALLAGVAWQVALIAALGLSLSSTAIALATLGERNLMGTPAGQAGFAILLFQDIAAIPMIALVPMLGVAADAGAGNGGWLGARRPGRRDRRRGDRALPGCARRCASSPNPRCARSSPPSRCCW
jgi:glutathione-regulated potassium-efflux system ancillary protein KefF